MKTVAFFYDKTKPHIDIKVLKSILEYRGISNLVKKDKDCCFIVHLDEDTHPELIQTVKDDFKLAKQYFYEEKYGNIIERMVKVPLNKPHPAVNPDIKVNGGALQLALNVLRRAGKSEVADELEKTAERIEH